VNQIPYFEQRCLDHQKLARAATCPAVLRTHLAFVRAYRNRIAELVLNDEGHPTLDRDAA
jgi:hypothetical protein